MSAHGRALRGARRGGAAFCRRRTSRIAAGTPALLRWRASRRTLRAATARHRTLTSALAHAVHAQRSAGPGSRICICTSTSRRVRACDRATSPALRGLAGARACIARRASSLDRGRIAALPSAGRCAQSRAAHARRSNATPARIVRASRRGERRHRRVVRRGEIAGDASSHRRAGRSPSTAVVASRRSRSAAHVAIAVQQVQPSRRARCRPRPPRLVARSTLDSRPCGAASRTGIATAARRAPQRKPCACRARISRAMRRTTASALARRLRRVGQRSRQSISCGARRPTHRDELRRHAARARPAGAVSRTAPLRRRRRRAPATSEQARRPRDRTRSGPGRSTGRRRDPPRRAPRAHRARTPGTVRSA